MDSQRARSILGVDEFATADEILAVRRRLALRNHPDRGGDPRSMVEINRATEVLLDFLSSGSQGALDSVFVVEVDHGIDVDHPSFVIDVLPVEAFEYVSLAAHVLGQVIDEEPPYSIELLLASLPDAWCRLDIVPDAGSSTVSISARGVVASDLVESWVDTINELVVQSAVTAEEPPPS